MRTMTDDSDHRAMTVEAAASLSLEREAFTRIIATEEVQHILAELDVLPENRISLFETLDADCTDNLSIGEILNGLTMLRGEPRRADVVSNGLMLRNLQISQATFREDQAKFREDQVK